MSKTSRPPRSRISKCDKDSLEELHYHVEFCCEAGFLTAKLISGVDSPFKVSNVGNLTWKRHEALDKLRKDGKLI